MGIFDLCSRSQCSGAAKSFILCLRRLLPAPEQQGWISAVRSGGGVWLELLLLWLMSVQGGEGNPRRDMSTATALCGAIIKQRSQAPTGAARSCRKEFPQEFPRLGCRQLPRALLCPGDSKEPSQHPCWAAMGVLCQDHDASLTQHHLCSGGRASPAGLLGQGEALGIAPQVKSGEIKG